MKYLVDYIKEEQGSLFENTGAFFAFGNEQFLEKRKEGVVYSNLGAGLICPKENINEFLKLNEEATFRAIRRDLLENGACGIIKREYFNYETHIDGDTEALLNSLKRYITLFPEEFSDDIINQEIKKCWNTAVEMDLF